MTCSNTQLSRDSSPQTPDAYHLKYYTEDGTLRSQFIELVEAAIKRGDSRALVDLISPLHESDLGNLLVAIKPDMQAALVELAGSNFDFSALTEVDEAIRLKIIRSLSNRKIAQALDELDSDDAVFILEDMEEKDRGKILEQMPFKERARLRCSLDYPEETAGRRMQTEFIAAPPFWSVGQTIDYIRESENLPDRFHEIFVVTPGYKLLGSIDLDRLITARRDQGIDRILKEPRHPIRADMDQEEAARIFEKYDLLSAAVIDKNDQLVGVMTIDDVVDVINQEVEEDIRLLVGVGDEEISDSVMEVTKSRFVWLLVNLVTSILASFAIGLFDTTISQMVSLAILMPIVASMGGNAGSQTMTVAVRALATRDMDTYNANRVIAREIKTGILNGLLFALIIGPITILWFNNWQLGVIISVAMIINMVCATAAGIFIPLLLKKLDVDPAISSSVFVTTVTDVIGFISFLGLASYWFGIP